MKFSPTHKHTDSRDSSMPGPFASPWIVIGGAVILGIVILVMTIQNLNRDEKAMAAILQEKGASLIKAMEAGVRSNMRGRVLPEVRLQVLIEEMASQPDILFMMVTDVTGRVLAHSEVGQQGEMAFTHADMRTLQPTRDVDWRIMHKADAHAFVVYRELVPFAGRQQLRDEIDRMHRKHREHIEAAKPQHNNTAKVLPCCEEAAEEAAKSHVHPPDKPMPPSFDTPSQFSDWRSSVVAIPPHGRMGGNGRMGRMGRMHSVLNNQSSTSAFEMWLRPDGPPPIIYIGLDFTPFEQARERDKRHTIMMAGIVLLVGLAGFISMVWAQNARRSRKLLSDSQALATEVVTSLPDGLVLLDAEGRIAFINTVAEEQLAVAYDKLRGHDPYATLPGEIASAIDHLTVDERFEEQEIECALASGSIVPIGIRGSRIVGEEGTQLGVVLILRDLREVRRLQEEVRRKEKLAAVGSLAAGVAHEIRNPLSSIKGYATYFGTRFPEGSEDRAAAGIMVQEVDRLNRVITDLIGLSRPSDLTLRPAEVGSIAAHCMQLLSPDATAQGVTTSLVVADDLPLVMLDPDRFSQAMLNICLNGLEAMPDGGTLAIGIDRDNDTFVRIEVTDSGSGIPSDMLTRIFDPYYTTKSQGTGLGLAIVHKIIEAHGGAISAASSQEAGTTFTILLPVADVV